MATFGNPGDASGWSNLNAAANRAESRRLTTPANMGTLDAIHAFVHSDSGSINVKPIVWTSAGVIVAVGGATSVDTTAQYNRLAFSSPPTLSPNTIYYFGFVTSLIFNIHYTTTGADADDVIWEDTGNNYTTPENLAGSTEGSVFLAIYGEYTAGEGATTGTGSLTSAASAIVASAISSSLGIATAAAAAAGIMGAGISGSEGASAMASDSAILAGQGTVANTADATLVSQASTLTADGISQSEGAGALTAESATITSAGLYLHRNADTLEWTWDGSGQLSWKLYWDTDSGTPYANNYAFGDADTRTLALRDFLTDTGLYFAMLVVVTGAGEGETSNEVYFDFTAGDLSSTPSTLSGQGTVETPGISGDAALTAQASTVSAEGLGESTGTATLVSTASTIGSEGLSQSEGGAALAASASSLAGQGTSGATENTAALTSGAASLSAEGVSESVGSGNLSSDTAQLSGLGETINEAISALASAGATITGLGELTCWASGALQTAAGSIAGEGTVLGLAEGNLAAGPASVAGEGLSSSAGDGAFAAGMAVIAGEGEAIAPGALMGVGTLVAQSAAFAAIGVIMGAELTFTARPRVWVFSAKNRAWCFEARDRVTAFTARRG